MQKGGSVGSGDPAGRKAIVRASIGLTGTMRKQAAKVRAEVRDLVRAHSGDPGMASNAREREKLFNQVVEKYKGLAETWGYTFGKAVDHQSDAVAKWTARSMPEGAKPKPLTEEQKIVALNGRTVDKMVAVATQSMGENAVRGLRSAAVRVFARSAVEGRTDNEIQKALQEEWDKEAGNEESHRFRDKNGRSWSNASYLQMLTRTTLANISRNTQISTLTQNGCDLARISDDGGGGSCDACARWSGRIVSLTGATKGYPTLDEAEGDGLFHPNCVHRIEYLDPDEIAAELGSNADNGGEDPDGEDQGDEDRDPEQSARKAIERVAKMEFKTSDGVMVRGGTIKGSAANYGKGWSISDGLNCFANAEAQEARCVYGLDLFPFKTKESWDEKGYEASARSAISSGTFVPNSALKQSGGVDGILDRLEESPDGTFLRHIGRNHSNGFVKQDGKVFFVDGWNGIRRERKELPSYEAMERAHLLDRNIVKTEHGDEYAGFVFISPSTKRAKLLAESPFLVGDKANSGLANR